MRAEYSHIREGQRIKLGPERRPGAPRMTSAARPTQTDEQTVVDRAPATVTRPRPPLAPVGVVVTIAERQVPSAAQRLRNDNGPRGAPRAG
jgi:hypothetical protein